MPACSRPRTPPLGASPTGRTTRITPRRTTAPPTSSTALTIGIDRIGDDLYNLAFVSIVRRDLQTGRQRFEESGKAFAAAGQSDRLADSTAAYGALEMRAGNLDKARDLLEEGRRLHIEQGNHARAADNTMVLSYIYLQRGEVEASREYLRKAMAAIREMQDVARFPLALDIGAAQALSRGTPAQTRFGCSREPRRGGPASAAGHRTLWSITIR